MDHIYFYQLLTFIPVLITVFWTTFVKAYQHKWTTALALFIVGTALVLNGLIMVDLIHELYIFSWLKPTQLFLACLIVPLVYMYFAHQIGREWYNSTSIAQWVIIPLVFLPNLVIDFHPVSDQMPMLDPIHPLHLNIYSAGKCIYYMSFGDIIILVQALLTVFRMVPMSKTLRTYDLRLSTRSRHFLMWWVLAFVFVVFTSIVRIEWLRIPVVTWTYFCSYAILISVMYAEIALGFDLNPVRTEDGESVSIDKYIDDHKEMAEKARRIFQEDRLYLQPGLVIDDVVSLLGTNRTYFTRMMRTEFGQSFTEYITSERINYAKKRMLETDLSLDEIAVECGMGNASTFCRVFKRFTDMTPESWRHQNKEE